MMTQRTGNWLAFLCCAGLLGFAYYTQYYLGLEPCPLCIFQRIGVAAIGLLFLLAALHGPGRTGAIVWGALIDLAVIVTIAVAARHIWIQHQPEGSVGVCGASLEYMMKLFSVGEVVRKVLTGSGECAKVTWQFLTLSMPTWVLISALGLGAFNVWNNLLRRAPPSDRGQTRLAAR
jgi:protein dithiol:quinone oxidoreductase